MLHKQSDDADNNNDDNNSEDDAVDVLIAMVTSLSSRIPPVASKAVPFPGLLK